MVLASREVSVVQVVEILAKMEVTVRIELTKFGFANRPVSQRGYEYKKGRENSRAALFRFLQTELWYPRLRYRDRICRKLREELLQLRI